MSGIVVETRQVGNVTYQLELVRCGKPGCRRCPHGPYWYAYWWDPRTMRTRSQYVGKKPPWEEHPKQTAKPAQSAGDRGGPAGGIGKAPNPYYSGGAGRSHERRKGR